MRVALLTHSTNPRGGVVHTLELARALGARGVDVTVIAPGSGVQPWFRDVPCKLECFDVPAASPGLVPMIGARIDSYVEHLSGSCGGRPRLDRFELLHAQDGIGANALATLRERGQIGGYVRTVHHLDHHAEAQLNVWEERAVRSASQVLCVSKLWCDRLRQEFGIDALEVSNGVNLTQFSPAPEDGDAAALACLGIRERVPLILSIGGVERRKNSVRILQAFSQLRSEHGPAQLAIVGGASILDHSGYRHEFERTLASSGLRVGEHADVIITGSVADGAVAALMRAARALAFPSLTEGFGLVVLEALACGTPAIVSRIPPFTEYLQEGDVYWVDPESVESIAQAMQAAITAPRFTPPAVCAAKSWDASAARHVDIYRQHAAHARRLTH